MKKILLTGCLILASLGLASAQGTVKFYNIAASFLISTNGTGTGAGQNGTTTGLMATSATAPTGYYFALFYDASAPTSASPLTGGWTHATSDGTTALVGNNYVLAGGITGPGTAGGSGGTPVNGIALGGQAHFEFVGWSASLGTSWAQVAPQYATGLWTAAGYFGISSESGLITTGGAGAPASSAAVILGPQANQINSGFNLNGVSPVPEPTTLALAALGGASLLLFRRKK
jgi:hypothetical protein